MIPDRTLLRKEIIWQKATTSHWRSRTVLGTEEILELKTGFVPYVGDRDRAIPKIQTDNIGFR